MCLKYLEAFAPVGIALLIILQGKALIIGIKCLFSHTFLIIFITMLFGGVGFGDPTLKKKSLQT
jgi:hypothetical protein